MAAWFVVVLTTTSGLRVLSNTSLMSREEADHEASVWQHTPCAGFAERNWAAEVREVR